MFPQCVHRGISCLELHFYVRSLSSLLWLGCSNLSEPCRDLLLRAPTLRGHSTCGPFSDWSSHSWDSESLNSFKSCFFGVFLQLYIILQWLQWTVTRINFNSRLHMALSQKCSALYILFRERASHEKHMDVKGDYTLSFMSGKIVFIDLWNFVTL